MTYIILKYNITNISLYLYYKYIIIFINQFTLYNTQIYLILKYYITIIFIIQFPLYNTQIYFISKYYITIIFINQFPLYNTQIYFISKYYLFILYTIIYILFHLLQNTYIVPVGTNLQNKGLISADRSNKRLLCHLQYLVL